MTESRIHCTVDDLTDIDRLYRFVSRCTHIPAKSTYQPSTPSTWIEKKTSASRDFTTASSFSWRVCGVAFTHSRVLRLRILPIVGL